ncbi:GAF domain-containing protein [Allokutzneria albata]|uniref:GAF domain-containing protein n=1 Tax=Allokutzneria albata TaxID=211114 RepID=A0A1G9RK64_ALLAB|nr:GAF domain-containing protein [Allokutzneria albata]SDM23656.1 GAF domain-containing protein [Allokutzneria albata]
MAIPPADPVESARVLVRVHEAVLGGGRAPQAPRTVIAESWRRSLDARVDPDRTEAPTVYARREVSELRAAHPLAGTLPALRGLLGGFAEEAGLIMIITDAAGHILWCEGDNAVRHAAERASLAEGTRWSEDVIGTNAMGTALALGRPVRIHSGEHLVRSYHSWTCAASPVRDPDTGAVLGVVDVSGPVHTAHPAVAALVEAAAKLAEGQLHAELAAREQRLRERNMPHLLGLRGQPGALLTPTGRVLVSAISDLPARVDVSGPEIRFGDGRTGLLEPLHEGYLLRVPSTRVTRTPRLSLSLLEDPVATFEGRQHPLSLRHAEILAALALRPDGLSAEALALATHGEDGNAVTVRAELHRLRAQLGIALGRKPYRLLATVDADFLRVRSAVRSGDVALAVRSYRGPLLPRSEAPVVRAEREELHAAVRSAAVHCGRPDVLWEFAQQPHGADDIEVHEVLARTLSPADPRRASTLTRLRALTS